MEAAQNAAKAVSTAESATNASASALAEVKTAAEHAMGAVLGVLDAFAEAAALGATTTEEAESAAHAAAVACNDAVTAAQHLGASDPIEHTTRAEYEVQTALNYASAAKSATHTLQGMIETIQSELTAPLISAANAIESESAGPMQTAAGALGNAKAHLESII
jgi:hypothetical protein